MTVRRRASDHPRAARAVGAMAPDGDDAVAGHHDIHVVTQAPAATIPERARG
jgi:hypothetical protein